MHSAHDRGAASTRQVSEVSAMREFGMYAVLLVLLIVGCIATLTALGQNANNKFNTVSNALPTGS